MSNIAETARKKAEEYLETRKQESMRNGADSMPPDCFDPFLEADVRAYLDVIPNFMFQGLWFDKTRYRIRQYHVGSAQDRLPQLVKITGKGESKRERVVDPQREKRAWVPFLWEDLYPKYLDMRRRYRAKGYLGGWHGLVHGGFGTGISAGNYPKWKGPGERI